MTGNRIWSTRELTDRVGRLAISGDMAAVEAVLRTAVVDGATALTAAWSLLAQALQAAGREPDAVAHRTRALGLWDAAAAVGERGSVEPDAVESIVAMLVTSQRSDDAVVVARATANDSHDPQALAALGMALTNAGDTAGAHAAFLQSSAQWFDAAEFDRALLYADLARDLANGATYETLFAGARALAAKDDGAHARVRYEAAIAADPTRRSLAFEADLCRLDGQPEAALARVDELLAKSPDDLEALAVRAEALRDFGRYSEAIVALDRLLDRDGGDRFRLLRAALRAESGNTTGALDDLAALAPIAAASPFVPVIRARISLNLQLPDDALTWLDQALQVQPGNALLRGWRAIALFGQGQPAPAESELDALLATPPADPVVTAWWNQRSAFQKHQARGNLLLIRGRLRTMLGRYPAARSDLEAALPSFPNRPDAIASLAQAILFDGDPGAAVALIESAPASVSGAPAMLEVKAAALRELGRYDEARIAIGRALLDDPHNTSARRFHASLLAMVGRNDDAHVEISLLAEEVPRLMAAENCGAGPGVYIEHASVLRDLDRVDEAIELLNGAADRFSQNAGVAALLGHLWAQQEDYPKAADALRRSLSLDPNQPAVAADLGEYLRHAGSLDEALIWLNRALDVYPDSPFALGTKGQVLRAMGDLAGGLTLLRQSAKQYGDDIPEWLARDLVDALGAEATVKALMEALDLLDRFHPQGATKAWSLGTRAEILRLLHQAQEGLDAAEAALQAGREMGLSDNEQLLGTKANLLVDLDRIEEALAIADRLLAEGNSGNNFARAARIRSLIALDRHAEALTETDRYLDVAPGDNWGLLNRADILSDYREFTAALQIIEALPYRNEYANALSGYCKRRIGDLAGAIVSLEKAVAGDPRVWWWWAELGETFQLLGDKARARRPFEILRDEATGKTHESANLLVNGAFAAFYLGDPITAVGLAQRALGISPTDPNIRFALAIMLFGSQRGLAALDEVEAAAALASESPDPRRGAAIVEEMIYQFELLDPERAFGNQPSEANEALRTLRETAAALRRNVGEGAGAPNLGESALPDAVKEDFVNIPGRPTLAQIYIKELRTTLDSTLVPVFAPNVIVPVGMIGSFDKGQFVSSGTTLADEFGIIVATRADQTPSDWTFASEGAVELTPGATITVGGIQLLTGKLSFTRRRSVVASFKGLSGTTAVWTAELNRKVWELYLTERLPATSVVVWAVRPAISGTVIVTRKGGTTVDLAADPTLLGGVLSLQGLGAGITFTGGTQAAVQMSSPGMTAFVRVKGVNRDWDNLVDVRRFEADPSAVEDLVSVEIPDLASELVEGSADWEAPEDDEPT